MESVILKQFLQSPFLNEYLINELDLQLKKIIPKWTQWIINKVPNRFLAQLLTGIEIKITTNKPGKITVEIRRRDQLLIISYTKETYVTEIEGNKNKKTKTKLGDSTL